MNLQELKIKSNKLRKITKKGIWKIYVLHCRILLLTCLLVVTRPDMCVAVRKICVILTYHTCEGVFFLKLEHPNRWL
jgi:hypothetical protein